MFDSATRHGRHVFSASLRYALGEVLVDRTIGVITQHQRQTGRNLNTQINQLLGKVGLTQDNLYSTCSDQGANMLRAADLIIEAQAAIRIVRGIAREDDGGNIDEILEDEINEVRQYAYMLRVEEDVDREVEQREQQQQQQRQQQAARREEEPTIADVVAEGGALCSKMVCGAHTCQLAARDVINEYQNLIAEIRNVVKMSKRMEFEQLLVNAGIRKLSIDCDTRWDSLYQMINEVHQFRNQLEEIAINEPRFEINEDVWDFIAEFVEAFTPVHFAMKDFQKSDVTMSDFYIRWEKMEVQITRVQNGQQELKRKLLEALGRRKQRFFECDAFIATLVLDPRINWSQRQEDFFGPALLERGILQIEKVHQVIGNVAQNINQDVEANQQDDEDEELNRRLGGGQRVQTGQNSEQHINTIRQKVNRFLTEPRMPSSANLSPLKYWYNKRDEEPELYKVSQVVYGAAFSQVKVERDFSGFALVLNHLRTLLADDTLNAILVGKNNLDLLRRVNFF